MSILLNRICNEAKGLEPSWFGFFYFSNFHAILNTDYLYNMHVRCIPGGEKCIE